MCDGGIVRNLDVRAHGHNNDGIDFEMSRNFLVEDLSLIHISGMHTIVPSHERRTVASRNRSWRGSRTCFPVASLPS